MGPDVIISIAGMLTGIVVTGVIGWGMVRAFQGPVGQALARRIAGGAATDPQWVTEVLELRHQLSEVQQRLSEAEERLDFGERLLAAHSESSATPKAPA